jgi:hypothetical protein
MRYVSVSYAIRGRVMRTWCVDDDFGGDKGSKGESCSGR